ncbi:PGPGW domain-containing protein [Engelhardtia mirabilis]|uniref:Transmembrane protein (PGPGW) n=1 Tax=Engelhardtia mirabilis TaxID=2528011 RepID=A0A518BS98_9BACT|nr:Putative transmembrane protein (PGPGW) [Planctomycetes bacterium Pla133]QDV04175.1 Putative transmembrane protein (PGPGW) [Planctomycetes bacterium Pla86]
MRPSTNSPNRRPLAFLCPRRVSPDQSTRWRRAGSVATGVPLILVGVLLIPTPLPGAVLIATGLAAMSRHFRAVRRLTISIQWHVRAWRQRRDPVASSG